MVWYYTNSTILNVLIGQDVIKEETKEAAQNKNQGQKLDVILRPYIAFYVVWVLFVVKGRMVTYC